MIICGTEYTKYDLLCLALVGVIILILMLAITTFFFISLVVFGGPTY